MITPFGASADIPIDVNICRARPEHTSTITGILVTAYLYSDLAAWLVSDDTARRRVFGGYVRMLAAHAIDYGRVDVITPYACALWYDIDKTSSLESVSPIDRYEERLAAITGPALQRFQLLEVARRQFRPRGTAHAHLAALAVVPGRQSRGFGTALLRHRHVELRQQGRHAYLEATGPRDSTLYQAEGYNPLGPYEVAPGGPSLHPMWWSPKT